MRRSNYKLAGEHLYGMQAVVNGDFQCLFVLSELVSFIHIYSKHENHYYETDSLFSLFRPNELNF